jgi:hypothetical protein
MYWNCSSQADSHMRMVNCMVLVAYQDHAIAIGHAAMRICEPGLQRLGYCYCFRVWAM